MQKVVRGLSEVHKSRATTFCTVAPNTCGFSVRNLLRVTLLGNRNLRRPPCFSTICAPLQYFLKKGALSLEQTVGNTPRRS